MIPVRRCYLTSDIEPVEALVRQEPEDFQVEEVPLYEPSGEGEHLYLGIEKRGIATHEALRRLAAAACRSARDFAYAGLKDARAVSRQTLSVHGLDPAALEGLDDPQVRVLWTARHRNKLKVGHLRGNRFIIRLHGVDGGGEERLRQAVDLLVRLGVPNFFGLQRFGFRGNTHLLGRALVVGDSDEFLGELLGRPSQDESPACQEARRRWETGDAVGALDLLPSSLSAERAALRVLVRPGAESGQAIRAVPRKMRQFYVSAFQSDLFNRYLAQLIEATRPEPELATLRDGDVAYLHRNGACFMVDDAPSCVERLQRFEISPSGPIFGSRMVRPTAPEALQREEALLAEEGVDPRQIGAAGGRTLRGERRALRFQLLEPDVRRDAGDVVLRFELPRGCYATSVLEELLKRPVS